MLKGFNKNSRMKKKEEEEESKMKRKKRRGRATCCLADRLKGLLVWQEDMNNMFRIINKPQLGNDFCLWRDKSVQIFSIGIWSRKDLDLQVLLNTFDDIVSTCENMSCYRGSVANMLVTSCEDNVCRIFVETILPDAGLLDLEQFDPAAAASEPKYHTQRHKKRFVQRIKTIRYVYNLYWCILFKVCRILQGCKENER